MSENDYETVISFRKSKYFWKFLNKQIMLQDLEAANGEGGYKILFFSSMPDNFNDCINENTGCLQSADGLTQITEDITNVSFNLGIRWIDEGENGFSLFLNNEENIDIAITEGVSLYVKGVALVKETGKIEGTSNYVIAYSRLSTPLKCQNTITLQSYSEFVGHSSCGVV